MLELEALIDAFGHRLRDTQLLMATPADLRGSSLVVDRRAWLERDSELFRLLLDADAPRAAPGSPTATTSDASRSPT